MGNSHDDYEKLLSQIADKMEAMASGKQQSAPVRKIVSQDPHDYKITFFDEEKKPVIVMHVFGIDADQLTFIESFDFSHSQGKHCYDEAFIKKLEDAFKMHGAKTAYGMISCFEDVLISFWESKEY